MVNQEAVERVARIYNMNKQAGQALGLGAQHFARLCRRYGIETPYARHCRRLAVASTPGNETEESSDESR
jgi:hypothetical protein